MNLSPFKYLFLLLSLLFSLEVCAEIVPDDDLEYLELRAAMAESFDSYDSLQFFKAVKRLEDFLDKRGDMHKYYTQRCNEVIFLLNQEHIFEAYMLSLHLSRELRERQLDSEMFNVINMLGHVYSYCGNLEMSRKCYLEALKRVEKEGYRERMPSICMNLAHEELNVNPDKAMQWLDSAATLADSPERLLSIAATRAVYSFRLGKVDDFKEGYRYYKAKEKEGMTAVFGYEMEVYDQLLKGNIRQVMTMIEQRGGRADQADMKAFVYEYIGDWKSAVAMRKEQMAAKDSINAMILSSSMQGIQNELDVYEANRQVAEQRIVTLISVVACLVVVAFVLGLLVMARRRQVRQLKAARDMALESDRMKSAFISNISHEVRTPLNIVNGFSQVLVNPDHELENEERQYLTGQIQENTQLIVTLVDELLDLSLVDSTKKCEMTDVVTCNEMGLQVSTAYREKAKQGVEVLFHTELTDAVKVLTNRVMLLKVLNALLNNAVKYTDDGEVRLVLRKEYGKVQFIVEDTGCGISAADSERVFRRFEKLDHFKSGLGLGLSLARAMTNRLHGELILDTSYTDGARFVLSLTPMSE